jgi:hypothetical protein
LEEPAICSSLAYKCELVLDILNRMLYNLFVF